MTSKIEIPYGDSSYLLEIDESFDLLKSKKVNPVYNLEETLINNLDNPIGTKALKELIRDKKSICIVIPDDTRPVPNKEILEILIAYIETHRVNDIKIKILIGTGSHDPLTKSKIIKLVGSRIYKNHEVISNDCFNSNDFIDIGYVVDGIPIKINKNYFDSDFKIAIGLIEPHPYAGFSGGRKAICPGICSNDSFEAIHTTKIVFSKSSKVGNLYGNLLHKIASRVVKKIGLDFIINITILKNKKISNFFCGDFQKAFLKGVNFYNIHYKLKTEKKYDLIITNGGGTGLDSYFYQVLKSINVSTKYIKKNGTIIVFAKCENGVGTKQYCKLLKNLDKTLRNLNLNNRFIFEQWNIQFLYKIFQKCEVYLFSDVFNRFPYLYKVVKKVENIDQFIKELKNKKGKIDIAIIEDGPFVI